MRHWPASASYRSGMASNTIIVPLDGSAVAEKALRYAEDLARTGERELLLVTVQDGIVTRGFEAFADSEHLSVDEAITAYLERALLAVESAGVAGRSLVVAGDNAADAILKTAVAEEAEMIVVATHGRSGVGKWLLGSVAEKIVRSARRPVLVVPADRD